MYNYIKGGHEFERWGTHGGFGGNNRREENVAIIILKNKFKMEIKKEALL